MLIDWFTVAAQAVNFLILVLLLKYLLFGRVVRAIDAREKRIAEQHQEADELRRQAEDEFERAREETRDLETQREARFVEIEEQIEEHRRRRIEELREEIRHLDSQWRHSLERQKGQFLKDLRGRVGDEVVETARRTLAEMANEDLEERIVERFLEYFCEIEKSDRQALSKALAGNSEPLLIETSFPLGEEQCVRIRNRIGAVLPGGECAFQTTAEISCGIRLSHRGREFAWTLDEYLDELAESVGSLFEGKIHSVSA